VNRRQRTTLVVGLIVAALLGLFPPWTMRWESYWSEIYRSQVPAGERRIGHYPLYSPPDFTFTSGPGANFFRVDYGRLVLYWIGVMGATAAGFFLEGRDESRKPSYRTQPCENYCRAAEDPPPLLRGAIGHEGVPPVPWLFSPRRGASRVKVLSCGGTRS
jgi:hypothetical protein